MRLFVTGGTGFIGSHFVRYALGHAHDIVALRRAPDSAMRLESIVLPQWLDKPMTGVQIDDLRGVDALVHLAAAGVSPQCAPWQELMRVNVVESLQLWQTAAKAGVGRIVVCGSCFEYGRSAERYDWLPPDAPLEPVTPYAASKAAASMAAMGLAAEYKVEVVIVRPFNVFGEGQHHKNFWPSLRRAALSGEDFPMTRGEQVRDFVPVERVAEEILEACVSKSAVACGVQVINIGSGHPQTLHEFAEMWWTRWNAKGSLLIGALPYRDGEVMRYVPAIDGAVVA